MPKASPKPASYYTTWETIQSASQTGCLGEITKPSLPKGLAFVLERQPNLIKHLKAAAHLLVPGQLIYKAL